MKEFLSFIIGIFASYIILCILYYIPKYLAKIFARYDLFEFFTDMYDEDYSDGFPDNMLAAFLFWLIMVIILLLCILFYTLGTGIIESLNLNLF